MRALWLLPFFALLLACHDPEAKVHILPARRIATTPVPLDEFQSPSFALSQVKEQECQGLLSFFSDYHRLYLSALESQLRCDEIKGPIYTPEELKEVRVSNVNCEETWRCFKVRWELRKGREKDIYYALLIRFDEENTRGLLTASFRNRSVPARLFQTEANAAQFLDLGLAPLVSTFDAWLGFE